MSIRAMLVLLLAMSGFAAPALAEPIEQLPDLWNIIPAGDIKIAPTETGLELRYTHNIANAGPGPLEIQPSYNEASGNYQGLQHIYSLDSRSGQWSISRKSRVAGAFVFHPEHGHFHFPMAAFGLHSVASDGGVGAPVMPSSKIGFCIGNSFAYNKLLPNFGAFLNQGPCTDPASLRGQAVGYVDNYDYKDPGQSMPLPVNPATRQPGLPDGTYWFRAVVDPSNFLIEGNEKNNITDIKIVIKNNQVVQTSAPVFPNSTPPSIAMTSPVDRDHLFGVISLKVKTQTTGKAVVQYLLDGVPLGTGTAAPDYPFAWDTTTVMNGTHWLAAQITDAANRTGTSTVVEILPAVQSKADTTAPTVTITDPETGSTVSGIFLVAAATTDNTRVSRVQFFIDNKPLGSAVTRPPFMTRWDTRATADGPHVLTVSATDATGNTSNTGKLARRTVIVDNSAPPPNPIGKDVVISQNGSGAITTPTFSTKTSGDLLIAFVAYDGPPDQAQTAIVRGAGLAWQLVKRSNTQGGTSEIWSARASGALTNATVTSAPERGTYDGSLTVVAFTNAAGTGVQGATGASSGAPDIPLPGIAPGNWVWAVGNDWSGTVARKPVDGQALVHQWLDTPAGNTFWVQSTAAPSDTLGLVDIHDSEPTNDRWNYAAVEIIATTPASGGQSGKDGGVQKESDPGAFFDGTLLTIPVVTVGSQKFRATLKLIPLEGSPTGYGFELDSATPTTASSKHPATFDSETGKVLIPWVDVMENGARTSSKDAQLTLIAGSDPMRFSLTGHTPGAKR